MGFLSKLFRKKEIKSEELNDWDELIYASEQIDFHDEEQRSRFIINCLEQMDEASKDTDMLTAEYNRVTSYLSDTEEIESLPEGEKEALVAIANKLISLEREREVFHERKNRMPDELFYKMRRKESEIEEGLKKLKETEEQKKLIKQDLRRLDKERYAYSYRKKELEGMCDNLRGMAMVFIIALCVCVALLCLLQFGFGMNATFGFLAASLLAAVAITIVCVKHMDARKEADKLARDINRLIQIQNKVKIRYVNNTNLLEYLCMKYDTDSAARLERRFKVYQKEKEERALYAKTADSLDEYREMLVNRLSRYHLSDPARFLHYLPALIDSREMVEVRHELILRRQSLRKQLEYNKTVAGQAHDQIMEVVNTYPEYAKEIMAMTERHNRP